MYVYIHEIETKREIERKKEKEKDSIFPKVRNFIFKTTILILSMRSFTVPLNKIYEFLIETLEILHLVDLLIREFQTFQILSIEKL